MSHRDQKGAKKCHIIFEWLVAPLDLRRFIDSDVNYGCPFTLIVIVGHEGVEVVLDAFDKVPRGRRVVSIGTFSCSNSAQSQTRQKN